MPCPWQGTWKPLNKWVLHECHRMVIILQGRERSSPNNIKHLAPHSSRAYHLTHNSTNAKDYCYPCSKIEQKLGWYVGVATFRDHLHVGILFLHSRVARLYCAPGMTPRVLSLHTRLSSCPTLWTASRAS